MFETLNQLAEQAATRASRRQFLDRLGTGALVLAAFAGGLLASAGETRAARKVRMCSVLSSNTQCKGVPVGSPCIIDNGEGTCQSDGNLEIAPGEYDCNWCRPKDRNPNKKDR